MMNWKNYPMMSDKVENQKNDHYFTANPKSELVVKEVLIKLKNGHEFSFRSPSGVFAYGKMNRATLVFLESAIIKPGKILDLGCGYGVVGTIIAKENPFVQIFMSDINKRAVNFAKENAMNHNLAVEIRDGNLFNPWKEMKFNTILFNPPMAAGKRIWVKAVEDSLCHLEEEGDLQIVAYHNKGGARIRQYMKELFGNVKTLEKSGGVRVYRSEKR